MESWNKYIGAAVVVLVVLFVLHTFVPANLRSNFGIQ